MLSVHHMRILSKMNPRNAPPYKTVKNGILPLDTSAIPDLEISLVLVALSPSSNDPSLKSQYFQLKVVS